MRHTTILDRWTSHVERDGDAAAVVTPERAWTRRQLAGFASGLRTQLAAPGEPVLIASADPVTVIAAILASAANGQTFAPVDVRQPPAHWVRIVQDLRPGTVISDPAGYQALGGQGPLADVPHRVIVDETTIGPWNPADWRDPDVPDAGYVYFTSGTTGRPKGIRGSLQAVEHFLDWETTEFGITEGTRISLLTSPGFDAFLRDALVPLRSGGSVRVAPANPLPVGAALASWLAEQQVEVLHCVPTVFRTLTAAPLTRDSLPSLRAVLLAGEPVRPSDVRWWRGLFGDSKDLVNLYGPSETTMTKVFRRLGAQDAQTDIVPAGRPLPGVEVRVRAAGGVVTGIIGEIEISTPFPLPGYLDGQPGGFTSTHDYRTGDLGRLRPDGDLEVIGRRDQQVKVRGARIELGEVEDALRAHPAVADACAAAVEGADGDLTLCAYVVADESATDEVLRDLAEASLAPGSRPAVYVRLPGIPRTLSGKADRRALPPPSAVAAGDPGDRPEGDVESRIAAVYCELLTLPAVGRHDDFTLLGGDSLAIARLIDRLRVLFGVEVPIHVFAENPTVVGLATAVTAQSGR